MLRSKNKDNYPAHDKKCIVLFVRIDSEGRFNLKQRTSLIRLNLRKDMLWRVKSRN